MGEAEIEWERGIEPRGSDRLGDGGRLMFDKRRERLSLRLPIRGLDFE